MYNVQLQSIHAIKCTMYICKVYTLQNVQCTSAKYTSYKMYNVHLQSIHAIKCTTYNVHNILLTKTTVTQNEVASSHYRVRGLYFLTALFAATIYTL